MANTRDGAGYISGQSPYSANNAALNAPSTSSTPVNATTAACANGDTACLSGVGVQQNAPLSQQTKEAIADGAASVSRTAGVVSAGATAVAAQTGPYAKPAETVAVGATVVGVASDAVNYLANPDPKKFILEQIGMGILAAVLAERYPLWAPIINEAAELAKQGGQK